jgi:anti-sigma B factor antagonist
MTSSKPRLQLNAIVTRTEDVVLEAHGELDLATAPALSREIDRAASAQCPRLVVDLTGVWFCDIVGLRALASAAREVEIRSGAMGVAVRPGSEPERLVELTGARESLQIRSSRQSALAAIGEAVALAT